MIQTFILNQGQTMNKKDQITRERIINEAEALFAKNGYDAVSVREITTAACCNLSAVNYHFGNKQKLYLQVFRARWVPRAMRVQTYFRESLASRDTLSISVVAHALAEAFLKGPLSDDERQRQSQLMTRELIQPTEAFELLAGEVLQPFFKELAETLHPLMPEGLENEDLMLNILSIFAMVIYFNFARVAVSLITGREYDAAFKDRLVKQIVEFSLNGLGGAEKEEDW
jgi:TetR/AcrR family transcriptional regulator, regulator of cefoperazone and chloramphenicol sensitivity